MTVYFLVTPGGGVPPFQITTPALLPGATVGAAYSQTLTQSGGIGAVTWSILSGTLSPGLSLSSGGVLAGTPTHAEVDAILVQALDSAGNKTTQSFSLTVSAAATVPVSVSIGTCLPGNASMSVVFTPNGNGGSAILYFTAKVYKDPGQVFVTSMQGAASPISVSGLTNGTQYQATVTATNAVGDSPSSNLSNIVIPSAGLILPGAPGNGTLLMVSQGQNSIGLQWTSAAAGTNPVASYKVYRNGTLYTTLGNVTSYVDNGAANTNSPIFSDNPPYPTCALPTTIYTYTVSAVDSQGNEGPQTSTIQYQPYYNGVFNWAGDYSYNLTANYADTAGILESGSFDIALTTTAAYGGWQPYSGKTTDLWQFESGAFDHFQIDLKPTKAGQLWNLSMVNRLPGAADYLPTTSVSVAAFGPTPQVGVWGRYTIPLSALKIGVTKIQAGLGAPYGTLSITLDNNPVTYNTATLSVNSVTSGPGVDVGGYLTGTGVPLGSFITQLNGNGTWVVAGPNITGSTSVGPQAAMQVQRTNIYKWNLNDQLGQASNVVYADNIAFTGVSPPGSGAVSLRQQIINYLASLPAKSTKKILMGQHADPFPSNPSSTSSVMAQVNRIQSAVGKYPALVSFIINDVQNGSYPSFSTILNCIPQVRAQNALVGMSWYVPVPNQTGGQGDPLPTVSDSQFLSMLPAGQLGSTGAWNGYFNSIIDIVGGQLAQALASGPIIFRPFIELNGTAANGFNWYGGRSTSVFQAVWKYVFSRLMGGPGSTYNFSSNLVWLYSINNYQGNYINYIAQPDANFSSYVDVLGTDTYACGSPPGQSFANVTQGQNQWNLMLSTGKPCMMYEAGPDLVSNYNGGNGPVPANSFSDLYLLNAITGSGGVSNPLTNCVGFNAWTQGCDLANQNDLAALVADSRIITASDLPVFH